MIGSRLNHNISRGEYAVLLNCTMTKAKEKTMAVKARTPCAMEENTAIATGTDTPVVAGQVAVFQVWKKPGQAE
jgi:hypothetical protein